MTYLFKTLSIPENRMQKQSSKLLCYTPYTKEQAVILKFSGFIINPKK